MMSAAAVFVGLALGASVADAQESAPLKSDLELLRNGTRLSVGGGLAQGELGFDSDSLGVTTDIGRLPTFYLGAELWPVEYAGVQLRYQAGVFGELKVPLKVSAGDDSLEYFTHQLEGTFVYRWFTGPRIDSIMLGLRVGFLLNNLTPSDHTPTVVLATTYFGPSLGAVASFPFAEGAFGLDLEGNLVQPFFVRESPDSSGEPVSPLGFHVRVAPFVRVARPLIIHVEALLTSYSVEFDGQGNRALGGVLGGSRSDTFQSARLVADWVF